MTPRFAIIYAARPPTGRILHFGADRWSLAYLGLTTAVLLLHWRLEHIHWPLVLLACALTYGCGCLVHNQAHLPLWRGRICNYLYECWLLLLRGDGVWAWRPTHIANHHRFENRQGDHLRTDRAGTSHHLGVWLTGVVIGLTLYIGAALRELGIMLVRAPGRAAGILLQLALLTIFLGGSWWADPVRAFWLIVVPQAFGILAMIATAYPQHHGCEADHPFRLARDFTGPLNNVLHFNHGFHTVHHLDPALHWSEWPAAHRAIADRLDPRLEEPSLPRWLLWTCLGQQKLPSSTLTPART
jgi:fatty acid desaturase